MVTHIGISGTPGITDLNVRLSFNRRERKDPGEEAGNESFAKNVFYLVK
jgi:hypothetical protein